VAIGVPSPPGPRLRAPGRKLLWGKDGKGGRAMPTRLSRQRPRPFFSPCGRRACPRAKTRGWMGEAQPDEGLAHEAALPRRTSHPNPSPARGEGNVENACTPKFE
jgi:hypothetical protein